MIQKKIAGEKAAEYIKDGMTLGLGTGSTAYYLIKKVGELIIFKLLQTYYSWL